MHIPYQIWKNNVFCIDLSYTLLETDDVLICFKLDKKPDLKVESIQIECTKSQWKEDHNQWYVFFNKSTDISPLISIQDFCTFYNYSESYKEETSFFPLLFSLCFSKKCKKFCLFMLFGWRIDFPIYLCICKHNHSYMNMF